jgi:hypothetical protein
MEFFKKYAETITLLAALGGCSIWINGKFTDMERRFDDKLDGKFTYIDGKMDNKFTYLNDRINEVKQDVAIIKTLLITRGIMPSELAIKEERKPCHDH